MDQYPECPAARTSPLIDAEKASGVNGTQPSGCQNDLKSESLCCMFPRHDSKIFPVSFAVRLTLTWTCNEDGP